ncbi:MAG: hypothetical protein LBS60_15765 [Deltaproteobacteria bacterium]|nr:hypothetical protein [Deltaproteobacteria bacterium]
MDNNIQCLETRFANLDNIILQALESLAKGFNPPTDNSSGLGAIGAALILAEIGPNGFWPSIVDCLSGLDSALENLSRLAKIKAVEPAKVTLDPPFTARSGPRWLLAPKRAFKAKFPKTSSDDGDTKVDCGYSA